MNQLNSSKEPMKRFLGNTIVKVESAFGRLHLSALVPADCRPLAVLMYHGLETEPERLSADALNIHPDACLAEIKFFLRQGYHPLAAEDVAHLMKGELLLPKARGFLLVTFDDGFACIHQPLMKWLKSEGAFPVLIAVCPAALRDGSVLWFEEVSARLAAVASQGLRMIHGGQELVFLKHQVRDLVRFMCEQSPTATDDMLAQIRKQTSSITFADLTRLPQVHKLMSWSDLRALRDTGQARFAAHSLLHHRATSLTSEQFNNDAEQCKHAIESELDVECDDFVYPFGSETDHSYATEAVLESVGFRRAYTTRAKLNLRTPLKRLDRLRGDGFGQGSLRYYRHLWRQWHAAAALEHTERKKLGKHQ
jgi:peptidoglycan/xylan/chitin deacetylase (PgdA/CDA1 family)